MATRSAVFQERQDGTFKGIYVHWNGVLHQNGAMLLEHYEDYGKTGQLIDNNTPLMTLGRNPKVIVAQMIYDERSDEFCVAENGRRGYFIAETLDEIPENTYRNYDGNHEVMHNHKGVELKGSDNAGFWYVQMLDGTWYVFVDDKYGNPHRCLLSDVVVKGGVL